MRGKSGGTFPLVTPVSTRRERENYPTPPDVALAITRRVAEIVGAVRFVIEPSAGSGSFVRAAREVFPKALISAVDIREEVREECLAAGADGFWAEDWLDYLCTLGTLDPDTLVLGNPPFRSDAPGATGDLATLHVLATLESLPSGSHLAFLLPISYLAGQDRTRRLWSRRDLLAWFPLAARPSFANERTAPSEYGVFVWKAGHRGDALTKPSLVMPQERGGGGRVIVGDSTPNATLPAAPPGE